MSNVPKLRFQSFTDQQEHLKLKVFAEVKRGAGSQYLSYCDMSDESYRLIRIGDFLGSDPVYVRKTPDMTRFTLESGDILIAGTGATAGITFEVPDRFVGMAYSYNAPRIRPNGVNSTYLSNYLKSPRLEKQKKRLFTGNAQPFLDTNDIRNFDFYISGIEEQQKIAEFLTAVDTKIEQLTRKEELLKQYKKGVMQKIFSQEIRFKADDGSEFPEWEKHKFHDVYKFMPTNSLSRADLNTESGVYRNIHYGDIHTKFPTVLDVDKEVIPFITDTNRQFADYMLCDTGDLVIADASEDYADIGKSVEIVNSNRELVVAGLHTILARPEKEMATGFSAYMVQSSAFRKQIHRIAQGAKVLGIPVGQLKKLTVWFPCYEEQLKIAKVLRSLDQKITSLNGQINEVKTFKKGLLQQMFV